MVDVVSDDDDLVDRSLDVSPDMDMGSDEEQEEDDEADAEPVQAENHGFQDHDASQEEEDMEKGNKENEPLVSDQEDNHEAVLDSESVAVILSSPSRAVSTLVFICNRSRLQLYDSPGPTILGRGILHASTTKQEDGSTRNIWQKVLVQYWRSSYSRYT